MLYIREVFGFIIILILAISGVLAQGPVNPSGVGAEQYGQIKNATDTTQDIVRDIEAERANFLSGKWKSIFLQNSVVKSIDTFFTKITWAFIVLFASPYTLSLTLFFAVLFWIFTFISLPPYFPFTETWKSWVGSFLATLAIAHLPYFHPFTLFASLLVKMIMYKTSGFWYALMIILSIGVALLYFYFVRVFGTYLELKRKMKAEADLKRKVEKHEQFQQEVVETSKIFREG